MVGFHGVAGVGTRAGESQESAAQQMGNREPQHFSKPFNSSLKLSIRGLNARCKRESEANRRREQAQNFGLNQCLQCLPPLCLEVNIQFFLIQTNATHQPKESTFQRFTGTRLKTSAQTVEEEIFGRRQVQQSSLKILQMHGNHQRTPRKVSGT